MTATPAPADRDAGDWTAEAFRFPWVSKPINHSDYVGGALATNARTLMMMGHPAFPKALDRLATRGLGLPTGNRWREALTTALLGDWVVPFRDKDRLTADAIRTLRAETVTLHRQLTPLWRRRAGGLVRGGGRVEGRRVLLLEAPSGGGITLRDTLADNTRPGRGDAGFGLSDERLARVLAALQPAERAVVLALGLQGVATWAEAAEYVGADDPPAFGERVRRKTRRLAAEQKRRFLQRSAAPAATPWRPGREGGVS
ncbi:hypothetical protein AB0K89_10745 [Streptomyces cinnamoneus]|uniref:hypothetical protein n=1 Tax=Streptomyces cinnamoneus TaxID=53446 RepID=UPI003432BFD6